MIYPWDKILITGAGGTLGRELQEILPTECIWITSADYDLTKEDQVQQMFSTYKPMVVLHLAAKVGSILYNQQNHLKILEDNLLMNTLMLKYSRQYHVQRFIGILSTCIYGEHQHHASYPLREEIIFHGEVPQGNRGYALSKRLMGQEIEMINQLENRNWSYIIPCNLFSRLDPFDLYKSHFVNALIKKIYEAVKAGSKTIELYGDGTARRQFIDSADLAGAIKLYLEHDVVESMNIVSEDMSIREMAELAIETLGLDLKINWTGHMGGQHRKDASDMRFRKYFPDFTFKSFEDGVKKLWTEVETREK